MYLNEMIIDRIDQPMFIVNSAGPKSFIISFKWFRLANSFEWFRLNVCDKLENSEHKFLISLLE
jgi:hypothetical protein